MEEAADRLAQHPIAGAILQVEVHRRLGAPTGQVTAALRTSGEHVRLEVGGVPRGPLWRHVRTLLRSVGYQPVGAVDASRWEAATAAMVESLTLLGVLHRTRGAVELTDAAAERLFGTPGHPQHEGEARYRDVLASTLTTPSGDGP